MEQAPGEPSEHDAADGSAMRGPDDEQLGVRAAGELVEAAGRRRRVDDLRLPALESLEERTNPVDPPPGLVPRGQACRSGPIHRADGGDDELGGRGAAETGCQRDGVGAPFRAIDADDDAPDRGRRIAGQAAADGREVVRLCAVVRLGRGHLRSWSGRLRRLRRRDGGHIGREARGGCGELRIVRVPPRRLSTPCSPGTPSHGRPCTRAPRGDRRPASPSPCPAAAWAPSSCAAHDRTQGVAMDRPDPTTHPVLLCYDGSDGAKEAIARAGRLLRAARRSPSTSGCRCRTCCCGIP